MALWNPHQPPEDGLPPQEVRITRLDAEPWPDGRRVRVRIEITPFLQRPNVEVVISEAQQEVSSITIIETIETIMSFTMHVRKENPAGRYTLTARLEYPEAGEVHHESKNFEIAQQPE